jgi:hypothetical protein
MTLWKIAKLINERGSQTVVFPEGMKIIGSKVSVGRIGKQIILQPIRVKIRKEKPQAKPVRGRLFR